MEKMKTYRVEQYETWIQGYIVEAKSRQDAARKVLNGVGIVVDETSFEFIEPNEDLGLDIGGKKFPSIRSVEED